MSHGSNTDETKASTPVAAATTVVGKATVGRAAVPPVAEADPPATSTSAIGGNGTAPGSNGASSAGNGSVPSGTNSTPGSAHAAHAKTAGAVASGAGGLVGAGAASRAGAATRVQVSDAVRSARRTVTAAASRGPRRARLQLKKVDPWSVMKFSFAFSIVLFIASVVATAILYMVLDALGVWSSMNESVGTLTAGSNGEQGLDLAITAKLVIGGAALLGAVNMVLFTALATLGAFIYNVCADLVGGIEVTLAERE